MPSPSLRAGNSKSYLDIGLGLSFDGSAGDAVVHDQAPRSRIVSAPSRLSSTTIVGRCSGLGLSLELPPQTLLRLPSDSGFSDATTITARPSPAMVSTPWAGTKVRIGGVRTPGGGALASPAIRRSVVPRRATPYPAKMVGLVLVRLPNFAELYSQGQQDYFAACESDGEVEEAMDRMRV
jgi:hypothetical protein